MHFTSGASNPSLYMFLITYINIAVSSTSLTLNEFLDETKQEFCKLYDGDMIVGIRFSFLLKIFSQ